MSGALALRSSDLREIDGEARVQDLRLGEVLGYADAKRVRDVVRRNRIELLSQGVLTQVASKPPAGSKGGRPEVYFLLNEPQALLVCMFSRTEKAAEVRAQVIEVFMSWRHGHLRASDRFDPIDTRVPRPMPPLKRGRLSSIDLLPESCSEGRGVGQCRDRGSQ